MFEVDISNLPSGINNNSQTASNVGLKQNYTNPFNPETNITFEVKQKAYFTVKVFDLSGKEVAKLVDGTKSQGSYNVKFNGANLSSGVYFYKLESGEYSEVKKMSLIK